ncbi:unnamed protein product, partial [Phaeothamnion confervicola]
KRRTRAELLGDFPAIDFSQIPPGADAYWDSFGTERETDEAIVGRAQELLRWLAARPEKKICVVSHSAFLSVAFRKAIHCAPALQIWFQNCEMRPLVLCF